MSRPMTHMRDRREKRVGIQDIAREAGVSISTVSHALNGTAPITEATRDRVIDSARRLGYLRQRRVRAAISTLQCILLVVPAAAADESETNLVTWTILEAVRQICGQRGIRVVPHVAPDIAGDASAIRAEAEAQNADAIIVFLEDQPEFVHALAMAGRPVVLVNGVDPAMRVDSVTPANRFGARLATDHLLDMGHRRILHLTFGARQTIRQRLAGYVDAMSARGIAHDDLILRLDDFEPAGAEAAIRSWVEEGGPESGITAIFCAADNLALGALRGLAAGGIRVPRDISVLGFDDIVLGELATPPLSSVRIPLRTMGETALELADQQLIAADAARPAHRLELGCAIVERSSCAAPRRSTSPSGP